jgi:hypothetical protein
MDIAPLQKWLALPPGPWPPDDRVLLGLPDGPVDAAAAEQNALERMELLRPHQLVNPDLVTEGMNRLAQALIALTSAPVEAPPPPPPDLPAAVSFAPTANPVVTPGPQVFEAEVVEAVVTTAPPRRPAPVPVPAPVPTLAVADEPEPVIVLDETAPPGTALVPNDRRKAYRELVFLRKLRRLWDRLGLIAGSPSEPVRSAEAVFIVLTAGNELRTLIREQPALATLLNTDGRIVSAVFTQPHAAMVFRELVPPQRTAVAADWAAGRKLLETAYTSRRALLRNSIAHRRLRTFGVRVAHFLRSHPEWVLGVLTVVLILAGLFRTMVRAYPDAR